MYMILGCESVSAVRKLLSVLEEATLGELHAEEGYNDCAGKKSATLSYS
jgi:hypothetical protein